MLKACRTAEDEMVSRDFVFWEVDVQSDFMLPGGKLYVPGAEKLLPNIRKLTDAARRDEVFLVSHGCFHPPDDPEFQQFPPHCLKGTPGAEFVPDALAERLGSSPEFVVFGVVTEYCVNYAAKGLLARKRRVTVVKDAIETLDPKVGAKTISDLQSLGARLVTTDEELANLRG